MENLRHYLINWLNTTYNPLESLEGFDIRVSRDERYPNLYNLKYGSILADKSNPLVRACRGAVVELVENDGDHSPYFRLVAYAFDRFFNIGEPGCHELNWGTTKVYEKLDGCLHSETKIETETGVKTIKEICDNPEKVFVFGFDHQTGEKIKVPIEGISVKKASPETQWYRVTLEDGRVLTLTGNHEVWDDASKTYVRVDELIGGEVLKDFT